MEIRINLLPQSNSQKETRSLYLIPVIGIVVVLAAFTYFTYYYFHTKDSIEQLSENIATQTTERDSILNEYQASTTGVTAYNFIDRYRSLNLFLNRIYENTIQLHESVFLLLPDQAKVMTYNYANNGDLSMTISFYSKGDSALFLHRLLGAKTVDTAEVESITADDETFTYQSTFKIKLHSIVGAKE